MPAEDLPSDRSDRPPAPRAAQAARSPSASPFAAAGGTRHRLDLTLLAADIATYEWDVVNDRLRGDRNLAQLFGLSLQPGGWAPLDQFLVRIHPEDRHRVAAQVQHCITTAENFESDYRIVGPAGDRWVTSRGRMRQDAGGRVIAFYGLVMDISARKRAEQEREAIAERLRRLTAIHETVLSGIPDFAYVFDLQGRFIYANRPLLRLYGRTLDQVVGKTFSQLGYPAWHAEMHLREIAEVIATRKPVQGEIPFQGESGISGVFDYIFTPIFGADGEVEAIAGTTRDVTDHKRAEARDRLLVSLDDATRPLSDPAAITQAAARLLGEYLGANRCAYADVEEDENTFNLTGDFNRDVPSIVGRYRFDQFGEECLRQMRAGEPYVVADAEADPRTAGVRAAYHATMIRAVVCVPLKKDGRFVAAMAVHQVTPRDWRQREVEIVQLIASRCWESIERTRVIRVLAESEQRLRLAVATGRLGVCELELPERVLRISDLGRVNHGRAPGEPFSYRAMIDAVHPADRDRVVSTFEHSFASGGEYELEHRVLWPDGSVHWILVRGQTSLGPDGRPLRMISVCIDITARMEAEHEQVRLREDAVQALRAKDDFLATLSHELRTPLNPILLIASDAAADVTLPPEARQSFETIRRNVELEARLIDDLLDLTSIVRGKVAIRREARDLRAIVEDAILAVKPSFSEGGVNLQVRLPTRDLLVHGDEVRLAQVFMNILKNAAKFTPRGGVVALEADRTAEDSLVVRVTDTGIGMTPAEIERAFAAFEQGDHAREAGGNRFGGLGLGLAISQKLVHLHGGEIVAESEGRNRGTTITVRLPALAAAASPQQPSPPSAAPSAPTRAAYHLLLVEDHDETRRALELLLRRRDYHVVAAGSIAEALQLASQDRFDLVVSDLGLPDGDGAGMMAELRDRHGLAGIALTGFGMDEDIARCRAAGFVNHLTKPIAIAALDSALRAALDGKGGRRDLVSRSL